MRPFAAIYDDAVSRKGEAALAERMPTPKSAAELAATGDDRWLAMMAKRVFQAGFVYRVVEAKWPGFEIAFQGFDPRVVGAYGSADLDRLREDTQIVRNLQKIQATVDNARFILSTAAEHGSFSRFVAEWPDDDIPGLWAVLKKRGARLGGDTGPRLLRSMRKDTYILTNDVVARLVAEGIVDKKPTSKKALAQVNDAFLRYRAESGLGLGALSVVLACSIDA